MNLATLHRIAHRLHSRRVPVLPKLIYYLQFFLFNSSVPASVSIGEGTVFGYGGIACIVHARAVIGKGCVIGSCVTIGGRSKEFEVPKIGDKVYIGSGAKILGNVTIGDNVIIGANAVVIHDVESNTVVGGIPAKVLKRGVTLEEYI